MDSVNGGKSDNLPFQTFFLCPHRRIRSVVKREQKTGNIYEQYYELDSSHHINEISQQNHHKHPLVLCNNKEGFLVDNCVCLGYEKPSKDYYFCRKCCRRYHKECVESPLEIKHSYHPKHSLKLFYKSISGTVDCLHCGEQAFHMVYRCTICRLYMHPVCAKEPVSFILDRPKRHDHPLTFFTRQASLDCNVCEKKLHSDRKKMFYMCNHGCTTLLHVDCLFGKDRFMKPRLTISSYGYEVQTLPNYTLSRPICDYCERRCGDNIFYKLNEKIVCSKGEVSEIIRGLSSP